MRKTPEVIAWYKDNYSYPGSLSFNPNGMCLMICRTARGINSMYPSAKAAQDATPEQYRVRDISKIKRGMVMYFDDPRDSNPYGHIVTVVGRVKGEDRGSLSSLLVRTNSVVSNQIVVVRADYFGRYWGDTYQFAATWLNGQAFPEFEVKTPKLPLENKGHQIKNAIQSLRSAANYHTQGDRAARRLAEELQQKVKELSAIYQKYGGK